jgi:hypothetical protein
MSNEQVEMEGEGYTFLLSNGQSVIAYMDKNRDEWTKTTIAGVMYLVTGHGSLINAESIEAIVHEMDDWNAIGAHPDEMAFAVSDVTEPIKCCKGN